MSESELPEPPSLPDPPRHVRLYRHQWIGLPLLALIPVLALAGVFGETSAHVQRRSDSLDVAVQYTDRYRYRQSNSLRIEVHNTGPATLDTITLTLDTTFANRFSSVSGIPEFRRAYEVELTDVRPGERALAVIELKGDRFGRHEGMLHVRARESIDIPLSILILP